MRESQNIASLAELKPDFMGFIFYEKSSRYVGEILDKNTKHILSPNIKKVGVFVNESLENILDIVEEYGLDMVQLHGSETVETCEKLQNKNIEIIKVFAVDSDFDFSEIKEFEPHVNFFLFDTKAEGGHGGHGKAFDWNVLKKYQGKTPFLLAGGVSLENIEDLKKIENTQFAGIDVNSKFELSPANKNIEALSELFEKIRK